MWGLRPRCRFPGVQLRRLSHARVHARFSIYLSLTRLTYVSRVVGLGELN